MKLYIKYMYTLRCKMLVQQELEKHGLHIKRIELGFAEIVETIADNEKMILNESLRHWGLELQDDKRSILAERVSNVVIEMIQETGLPEKKYSQYISQKLDYDYTYLANVFSEVKGMSIRDFIIRHRIEKVKELLLYNELNLSEIADKLHYSSVSHVSMQFKKATGLTPTLYKKVTQRRTNLEDVGVLLKGDENN